MIAVSTAAPHEAADGAGLLPPFGLARWDLLVVGGGTAGIVAAQTAAGLGASVLLVERGRTGGDCLWTGCVPSKALLAAASAAAAARGDAALGVHVSGVRVDFDAVMDHVRSAIAAIEPGDSPQALGRAGVQVTAGTARFTGPTAAEVDGRPVRFRQALIATGSEPALPPIPGLADVDVLTSDTLWNLTALPPRLAVLGGGAIGCELAQAFARLGSDVTLVEAQSRLLTREDPAAARLVTAALERDGVTVRVGVQVTAVRPGLIDLGGSVITFDRLLVATGRRPRSADLGLGAAGVDIDGHGYVQVDARLCTSNRRIWAAGDITGNPQFTHTAGVHAATAATNAVLGLRRRADRVQPRVTFTDPEVAAIGLGTARDRAGLHMRTVPHRLVDRAVTDGDTAGFTRLVLDGKGRILGATIVAPRAGEMLAELAVAVRRGLTAADLAGTTHAYPTYAHGPWTAAIGERRAGLARPATAGAIRVLARIRRRRLDWRGDGD